MDLPRRLHSTWEIPDRSCLREQHRRARQATAYEFPARTSWRVPRLGQAGCHLRGPLRTRVSALDGRPVVRGADDGRGRTDHSRTRDVSIPVPVEEPRVTGLDRPRLQADVKLEERAIRIRLPANRLLAAWPNQDQGIHVEACDLDPKKILRQKPRLPCLPNSPDQI